MIILHVFVNIMHVLPFGMRLHVVHGYDKHSLMTLNQSDHAYTNARERDDGGLRGNVNDVCNLRGTHGLLVDVITWKVLLPHKTLEGGHSKPKEFFTPHAM